jgi:hypothetical protein
MTSIIRRVLAPLALVTGVASAAGAQSGFVIDFEDLGYGRQPGAATEWGGGTPLSTYRGFEWTNLRPLDLVNYQFQPAGYPRGPVTGDVLGVGFGPVRMVGASPFTLLGGMFGSGWTDPTLFTVNGFLGSELQFTHEVRLSTAGPTTIDFGSFLVDEVVFTPDFLPAGYVDTFESGQFNGGTPYQSFYVDNLAVSFGAAQLAATVTAPEPASMVLLGSGLLALAGVVRVRRRSATA